MTLVSLAQLKRSLILILVPFVMCVMTIDTMPPISESHRRLQQQIFPVLNWLGIGQGVWSLFAPNPLDQNVYFSVRFDYQDGSNFLWVSPHWERYTILRKFFATRHINFYTYLPNDNSRMMMRFVDWLVRERIKQGDDRIPVYVVAKKFVAATPPPPKKETYQYPRRPSYGERITILESVYPIPDGGKNVALPR